MQPQSSSIAIKPMPLWQALLYFGLPALLFRISLYNGTPALIRLGISPFKANVVSFTVPAAILFAIAFIFYKRDGYPLSWSDIKIRFRLLRMTGKDWLWAVGGFLITFLSIGVLAPTALLLINSIPVIAPPDFFPPWLKPSVNFDTPLFTSFIGEPLKSNWGIAVLFFIMPFFNIAGEELWWRGYILPRQEKTHGPRTWLIHGLLWWLWHLAFYPWQVFALLPICLALPYVAQRRQNTWVAFVIHLQNAIILLIILAMVLGIMLNVSGSHKGIEKSNVELSRSQPIDECQPLVASSYHPYAEQIRDLLECLKHTSSSPIQSKFQYLWVSIVFSIFRN